MGLAPVGNKMNLREEPTGKLKKVSTDFRRYRGRRYDPNFPKFVDNLFEFTKRYRIYADVVSNYARSGFTALKEFKDYVINYEPALEKKRLFQRNHYVCLEIKDRNILEGLFDTGGGFLMFQFRICDGDVGAIPEYEQKLFERRKEDISEALFDDPRTIAVIKDKWDCVGLNIMYRDTIEEKYERVLLIIAGLKESPGQDKGEGQFINKAPGSGGEGKG